MTADMLPRVLPLKTGHNFRDMGGYATMDGRRVKWRRLFRSGYMAGIQGEDRDLLTALGIDTICDLRANDERAERPTRWHIGTDTELWERDHLFSAGALHTLAKRAEAGPDDTRASMFEIYSVLPHEQSESYGELFRRLAAGRVPVLFNCSAGKDRTGVAGALILSLLGVPRATIEEDYLLSNTMLDGLIQFMKRSPQYAPLIEHRMDLAMPMLRVEPDYLARSFAVIEREHGTVERYLDEVLGIDADGQAAIREHLLD